MNWNGCWELAMPPELERHGAEAPSRLDQEPAAGDTMRLVTAEVLETMFFTEAEDRTVERCCWAFRRKQPIRLQHRS
jgi:hypothetical protein